MSWLEIKYGRQAAIFDFPFRSITQEPFELFQWFLGCECIIIRYRSSSILEPIGNPTWPPASHLGFSFPLNNSRTVWGISMIFRMWIYHYMIQVKFDFGANRKSNMAARQPIFDFRFRSITQEPLEIYQWFLVFGYIISPLPVKYFMIRSGGH